MGHPQRAPRLARPPGVVSSWIHPEANLGGSLDPKDQRNGKSRYKVKCFGCVDLFWSDFLNTSPLFSQPRNCWKRSPPRHPFWAYEITFFGWGHLTSLHFTQDCVLLRSFGMFELILSWGSSGKCVSFGTAAKSLAAKGAGMLVVIYRPRDAQTDHKIRLQCTWLQYLPTIWWENKEPAPTKKESCYKRSLTHVVNPKAPSLSWENCCWVMVKKFIKIHLCPSKAWALPEVGMPYRP